MGLCMQRTPSFRDLDHNAYRSQRTTPRRSGQAVP